MKNRLIELQLNEEQIESFSEAIDNALSSMKDRLDFMYNDWMENGINKEEDDKEDDRI